MWCYLLGGFGENCRGGTNTRVNRVVSVAIGEQPPSSTELVWYVCFYRFSTTSCSVLPETLPTCLPVSELCMSLLSDALPTSLFL